MAKSVRASASKRNSANLRAKVFGPAADARTARLSAKLQELASQPKPANGEESNMKTDATETDEQNRPAETQKPETSEDMDIDRGTTQSTKSRSNKSGRIQKRYKMNRSSIVFPSGASKAKVSKRK